MVDLPSVDPTELFTNSWFQEYQRQQKTIGYELLKLNACLFVLNKIEVFPFFLFAPYREKSLFWRLTSDCMAESAVLVIWKVYIDNDARGLTLRQFKNGIIKNLKNDEVRESLQATLRHDDFEGQLSQFEKFEKKVYDLRLNIVAHWNQDWISADDTFRALHAIGFSQLQAVADILNKFFQLLCFGSGFTTMPSDYEITKHDPSSIIDIDELLDDIARKSEALYWPEKNPHIWQQRKAELSTDEIDIFNRYREKFELAPA